ncbi:hypothetical protein HG531_000761 [Fusarium graminearum]|nr:hypothetical protein HG531_000761 [Fusarium graminearum]
MWLCINNTTQNLSRKKITLGPSPRVFNDVPQTSIKRKPDVEIRHLLGDATSKRRATHAVTRFGTCVDNLAVLTPFLISREEGFLEVRRSHGAFFVGDGNSDHSGVHATMRLRSVFVEDNFTALLVVDVGFVEALCEFLGVLVHVIQIVIEFSIFRDALCQTEAFATCLALCTAFFADHVVNGHFCILFDIASLAATFVGNDLGFVSPTGELTIVHDAEDNSFGIRLGGREHSCCFIVFLLKLSGIGGFAKFGFHHLGAETIEGDSSSFHLFFFFAGIVKVAQVTKAFHGNLFDWFTAFLSCSVNGFELRHAPGRTSVAKGVVDGWL